MLTKSPFKINFFYCYIVVIILLFILASKTVFFGYLKPNKYFTLGLLFLMCIGLLMIKRIKILRANISKMLVLVSLMGTSIMWNSSSLDSMYINGALALLMALIEGMILVVQCPKSKFIMYYINIITGISIISLICFLILIFAPGLIQLLGATEYRVDGSFSIIYSPLYTWGWWNTWSRNASMWTEPGFFQMFITFAILMIISYSKQIRHANIKLFVLIITILTTQSTVAYLILIIIIIMHKDYCKEIISKFRNRANSTILMLVIGMTIVMIIAYLISSGVIQEKILTENSSKTFRTTDFLQSIYIIFNNNPLFGIGFGEKMVTIVESYGIINNSNGLLTMAYVWGIPFTLFYIYQYIKGTIVFFEIESRLKKMGMVLIIFIIFTTQVFWLYPFFLIFFFEWKEIKNDVYYLQKVIKNF